MPRIIETTVYTFEELDDAAKERARDWWRSCDVWNSSDWWASAQAFSEIAPIDITGADYDRATVEYRWAWDDDVRDLSGVRAWKWLQNNDWFDWAAREKPGACTATGFCGDAPFADPLAEYARTPGRVPTIEQVFYECAQAWVQEARRDYESSLEDEQVDECLIANEYEFDAEGNRA